MLILRDYQNDAVKAFFDYCGNGGRAGVISISMGGGKSIVIAEICKILCTTWPQVRVCNVTHSRELIQQNYDELKGHYPEADAGIYSAGLNSRDLNNRIIFCGIQSIYNKAFQMGKIDLIVIDEAHLCGRDKRARYYKFLHDLKMANPNIVLLGLTGTAFRLDSGLLYEGPDKIFDDLIYEIGVGELIEMGFLCPMISKGGIDKIDLESVHTRAGDYVNSELEHAADNEKLTKSACAEIIKYGESRSSWLIFSAGKKHAGHIKDEMIRNGITCEIVMGDTPKKERDQIIADFRHRKIRAIVNILVLTTGVNIPGIDLVALLTATKSPNKYSQMCGRSTRIAPGKENALILDYGKNIITHGPLDKIIPPQPKKKGEGNGDAPCKECPICRDIVAASVRLCPACFFEFPRKDPHESEAYAGAVLSQDEKPVWVEVLETGYSRHHKTGKPDSIRADFETFYNGREHTFSHWITLDHTGYAGMKAAQYVAAVGGTAKTVDHALQEMYYWTDPIRIEVRREGKFWRILRFDFPEITPPTIQKQLGEALE